MHAVVFTYGVYVKQMIHAPSVSISVQVDVVCYRFKAENKEEYLLNIFF